MSHAEGGREGGAWIPLVRFPNPLATGSWEPDLESAYLIFVTCTTCDAGVKIFSLVSKQARKLGRSKI